MSLWSDWQDSLQQIKLEQIRGRELMLPTPTPDGFAGLDPSADKSLKINVVGQVSFDRPADQPFGET